MVCAFFSGIRATALQFEPLRGYRSEKRKFLAFLLYGSMQIAMSSAHHTNSRGSVVNSGGGFYVVVCHMIVDLCDRCSPLENSTHAQSFINKFVIFAQTN